MGPSPIICRYALFCKESSIEPDGAVSLHSILSAYLRVFDFPVTIPLCFVAFLELSLEEYRQQGEGELALRLIVTAPNGVPVGDVKIDAPFTEYTPEMAGCSVAISLGESDFWEPGDYEFSIFVNNAVLYTTFLHLTVATDVDRKARGTGSP